MNNQEIEIARLALQNPKEEGQVLQVELRYDLGGPNWVHGGTSARGYYLTARPKTYDGAWVKMDLMSGLKDLLEPAKRFSRKTLELIANDVKRLAKQEEGEVLARFGGLNVYNRLIHAVCQKDGLVLVDPIPTALPNETQEG